MHIRTRGKVAALTTAGLLVGLGAGVAVATIPGSDGVIKACYEKKTGLLRVVDSGQCTRFENQLRWNQTGLPGPAGPAGPAGTADAAGPPPPAAARTGHTTIGPGLTGTAVATCEPGEFLVQGEYDAGVITPGGSVRGLGFGAAAPRDQNQDGIFDGYRVSGVNDTTDGTGVIDVTAWCADLP